MIHVSTASAAETVSSSGLGVHVSACGARSRTVRSWNFDKCSACAHELHFKARPSGRRNAQGRSTALHRRHVEFLNHDDAVALGKSRRLNMQEMFALSPGLPVKNSDTTFRFGLIFGSLLSSRNNALSVSESLHCTMVMPGIFRQFPIGTSQKVDDASIESDDGAQSRFRIGLLDLAHDRHEPTVAFSRNRAGSRRTFKRAMENSAQVSDLREPKRIAAADAPLVSVCFGKRDPMPFAFPSRHPAALGKEELPGFVQIDQHLGRHVVRHILDPWRKGPQVRQLVDLIEGRHEDFFTAQPGEAQAPLLVREVPEPTHSVLPRQKAHLLRFRRVDAVLECLVSDQGIDFGCPLFRARSPVVLQRRGDIPSSTPNTRAQ